MFTSTMSPSTINNTVPFTGLPNSSVTFTLMFDVPLIITSFDVMLMNVGMYFTFTTSVALSAPRYTGVSLYTATISICSALNGVYGIVT